MVDFQKGNNKRQTTLQEEPTILTRQKGLKILVSLVLALFFISLAFHIFRFDPKFSGLFFDPESGWIRAKDQPWLWLFQFGTIPGILLTLASLIGWFLSYFLDPLSSYRRYFLLIFLTAIIGGGIIVNALLKDYWGRPRPRQTIEFGGHWEYRQVCEPGTPGKGKSFPCGHCTMGYLFTILFFFRNKNKWIAYVGGGFGVIYGAMISMARVVQGAHFLQDTIWSLGVLWITATILHYFIIKTDEKKEAQLIEGGTTKKMGFGLLVAAVVTIIVVSFMTRRPYFRTYKKSLAITNQTTQLNIQSNFTWELDQIKWHEDEKSYINLDAKGFGLPNVYHYFYRVQKSDEQKNLNIDLEIYTQGYFSELNHDLTFHLAKRHKKRLKIHFEPSPSLPKLTKRKQ